MKGFDPLQRLSTVYEFVSQVIVIWAKIYMISFYVHHTVKRRNIMHFIVATMSLNKQEKNNGVQHKHED